MSPGHALVRVLGPVRVAVDGMDVPLPARKVRQLLAAMVVAPGSSRSRDRLVDSLWGAEPPRSADKVLQQYVSQLRRAVPSLSLRTTGDGYVLELADDDLDATSFERIAGEGRLALAVGDSATAAASLSRALALWDGDAFGEFAGEDFALSSAVRLEDLRRDVVEERLRAELELGGHDRVLPELRALAADAPLREGLQSLAMVALYRAGRQSEALGVYRTARAALVRELGVEPGAALREVHRQVLEQSEQLLVVGAPPGPGLPVPVNALRGRARELGDLRALVSRDDVRLVVLTGAGGSGKTRLAIEVARAVAPDHVHGCALVELADVHDAAALLPALCSRLGIARQGEAMADLVAALGGRDMLLVLDNVEQLRDAGHRLVELLERAPRLRLLVTSRVVLHVSGEHVFPVDPLGAADAAALFVERGRSADARLGVTDLDPETVRLLCERLDGLPLAIELAAARLRTLTATELLARLASVLPTLSGGPRDLPMRQRTLQATLEWSHDLLDEVERRALARLSVFAGGWGLDAAEGVCDVDVDVLSGLVDHHLVVRRSSPGGSRFDLLETVRVFAAERLAGSGDRDEVRRRHAEHLLHQAAGWALSVEAIGGGAVQRHGLAMTEQGNLHAALDWAVDEDPLLGLELALAVEQHWITTDPREGARRIRALLGAAADVPPTLRARALRDLGGCSEVGGDADGAVASYRLSLDLCRKAGDELAELRLRHRLLNFEVRSGALTEAREECDVVLALARSGGHLALEADMLATLAWIHHLDGELDVAYAHQLTSLNLYRGAGGWAWGEVLMLAALAELASGLRRFEVAEEHAREALRVARDLRDPISTAVALGALTAVALDAGDDERAGLLWGTVEGLERRAFLGRWAQDRSALAERVEAQATDAFERGRTAGTALALIDALDEALGAARAPR